MKRAAPFLVPVLLLPVLVPVLFLAVFAGAGLTNPALSAGCPATAAAMGGESVASVDLDGEQMSNAAAIVAAVRGFPATSGKTYAAVVALATSMQESGMRNLDHGDRDSLGLFQQRPSQGWGTPAQVRDPAYATRSFLVRLVKVPVWETMRVTDAAATVQRPAEKYRGLYEQWVPLATGLTERLWGSPTATVTSTAAFLPGGGCVGGSVPANCAPTGLASESGLTPDALRVMRCALTVFGLHTVLGVGERSTNEASDHPAGRAVDIMISRWDTPAGNAHGWEVAQWVQENASQLGVTYVIFDKQIWSPARDAEGWRPYNHPSGVSNPTLDHRDHVHVSVHGNAGTDTPIPIPGADQVPSGAPVVATFNVLGHSHTTRGGNKPGMADGAMRMAWSVQLLRENGVSVVGFQEFESPQARAFTRLVAGQFATYPGLKRPRDNKNAIAWRTDTWELVVGKSYEVPYFDGHPVRVPAVLLRHTTTGKEIWFTNHHNPADTRRYPRQQHWRDVATQREIAFTRGLLRTGHPVVVTGDMNEKEGFFCRFTGGVAMHASNGGGNTNGCQPPEQMGIDWIFGSTQVRFSRHQVLQSDLVRRTTDHPLVMAQISLNQ